MKSLEELKEMREEWLKARKKDKWYDFWKNCNFVAYSYSNDDIMLAESYKDAKTYADMGGQVLVLNKDKIYTYKVKTLDEYQEYLTNEIRREAINTMNRYGL